MSKCIVCVPNGSASVGNTHKSPLAPFVRSIQQKPTSTNSLTRQSFIHASCNILPPIPKELMAPSTIYGVQVCIHLFLFRKKNHPDRRMEHTHTHTTQQTPKIWIILCLFILYVGRLVPCFYYSLFIIITSPTGAGSFSLRLTNSFWKYHKIVKWQKYQTVWQSFEIELKRMTTRGRRNENRKKKLLKIVF